MKKFMFFVFGVTAFTMMNSCAKIYNDKDAMSLSKSHSVVAVLPPTVSISAKKKIDAEAMKEQQKTESTNFQKEMYSWLLKRKMQNRLTVEIQDVETTNAKLRKAGYFDHLSMTPSEICEVLGVDGLITSNYALSQPMSEGGAVAMGLLVGVWGNTNETTVVMEIHDKNTRKMIWNYNHKVSGSVGSSSSKLVDNLMRNASRKMPYSRKA